LKKSILALLREMVTLTVSSFNASSSGEGRKSEMTLTFPIGSSVYFILAAIYLLSFPPISGADNSDFVFSVGKPNCHNSTRDPAKAIKPFFTLAMFKILILSFPPLAHPRQTQMSRAGRNKILGKKKGKKIRGNAGGIEPQPKRGH
jgi:hypothetical protein